MLNALELEASAVGNHEFDKGFADLTGPGHRRTAADLGLPRRERLQQGHHDPGAAGVRDLDVNGVKVGVIGAVTEETPSLVTPGGITDARLR